VKKEAQIWDIFAICKKLPKVNMRKVQHAKIRPIWDRCYDFLNIFAEKFGEKIRIFDSKQS
jgi:hypothetical protein